MHGSTRLLQYRTFSADPWQRCQPKYLPFLGLSPPSRHRSLTQSPLRAAITAQTRADEAECVARLLETATLPSPTVVQTEVLARRLVTALRAKGTQGAVEGLMREYALSSDEGVALMCLAEALLRIPDRATRDALIRDKISQGRLAKSRSATPRRCLSTPPPGGFWSPASWSPPTARSGSRAALARLIARGGEPVSARASISRCG